MLKKTLLSVSLLTISATASAAVCEVHMLRSNGSLIKPIIMSGATEVDACREARKACRLELTRLQRRGQLSGADCQRVATTPSPGPTIPGPTPIPPGPNPVPPGPNHGGFNRQLNQLESELNSGSWRVRQYAAEELSRYPVPRALALAVKAMRDNDSDVRNAASRSVNQLMSTVDFMMNVQEVFDLFVPMTNSGSWMVRQKAVMVLGHVPTADAIIPVLSKMNDNDSDVRNAATQSLNILKQMPDLAQSVLANLDTYKSMANSGSWKIRNETVKILGVSELMRVLDILVKKTGDNDSDVRNSAERAINNMISLPKITRATPNTIRKISDIYFSSGSWRVRLYAVKVLGATRSWEARDTLVRALNDNDSDVRRAADNALRGL